MTFGEARHLIKMDIDRNRDLSKNRFFIRILRMGQWGHWNYRKNLAAYASYYLCRGIMRLTLNKYNHYSYGTAIGGALGFLTIWESLFLAMRPSAKIVQSFIKLLLALMR